MFWSGKTATAVNGVLEEQRGTEGFRVLEKQAGTTGNGFLERKNSKCTTWCLGNKEQYLQKMVSWI
jgi:hypothetical protein